MKQEKPVSLSLKMQNISREKQANRTGELIEITQGVF